MKEKKRARAVHIDGMVHQGDWDEEWDTMVLTVVTPEQKEYLVKPDKVGTRLADNLGDFVNIDGLLEPDESKGRVLRVRSFEVIKSGFGGDNDDADESPEDENRISTMGFIPVRSRQRKSSYS